MAAVKFKILPAVLIVILLVLQYRLWFENGGLIDMYRMKKQLAMQVQQNEKLKKRNEKLLKQVQYMQASNDAVESKARGELGMIKKGETFYQVVK